MKKILSVVLSVIIILSSLSVLCYAIENKSNVSDYPVIIVPGYSGSALVKVNKDGSTEDVWGVDFNKVISRIFARITDLGIGVASLTAGNADYIAKVVGEEFIEMFKDMKCNDDGSSAENIVCKFPDAASSQDSALLERFGDNSYRFEPDITNNMLENGLTLEQIFCFNNDWRMGAVDIAAKLDEYIQQVKQITGKDKVNIFSISHGGQVTGTYLSIYGNKRDVNNAILNVPALSGAALLYDVLTGNAVLDEQNLLNFLENGLVLEDDYHWLVEAQELGFLDKVIKSLIPYLLEMGMNWGSAWDFCPPEYYEELKTKWLDPVKNKVLIEKSDYMHNVIMKNYSANLTKCRTEYDISVNIIAGCDVSATSGWQVNSDGIIHTASSTGATCAPFGQRFSDGYTQINPCNGLNKVSPSMTIDASTCYLPDNTWFVSGLFHGMMYWDDYSKELLQTLLLTREIENVYSNKNYPQFHTSTNASYAVFTKFNKSDEGFVSGEDTSIIVKNLSKQDRTIIITAITCDGVDLKFDLNRRNRKIKAGESTEISFAGTIPSISNTTCNIIVSYIAFGSLTPIGERTQTFTIMNGEKPSYNQNNPYTSASAKTPLEKLLGSRFTDLLKKLNLYNFATMIFNVVNYTISSVF